MLVTSAGLEIGTGCGGGVPGELIGIGATGFAGVFVDVIVGALENGIIGLTGLVGVILAS